MLIIRHKYVYNHKYIAFFSVPSSRSADRELKYHGGERSFRKGSLGSQVEAAQKLNYARKRGVRPDPCEKPAGETSACPGS